MNRKKVFFAIAGVLLFPLAALGQMSLSLNLSSTGDGTGAWTTLPNCSGTGSGGPGNALTFDSGKQAFGCTALPDPGQLEGGEHLTIGGAAPSITAGAGAGKSPTALLGPNSNDSAGWIELTTGSSPASSAVIVTVTAATPVASGNAWNCGVAPANDKAAALNNNQAPYVPMPAAAVAPPTSTSGGGSLSAFTVTANSQKLAASTEYIWRYWCVELQ